MDVDKAAAAAASGVEQEVHSLEQLRDTAATVYNAAGVVLNAVAFERLIPLGVLALMLGMAVLGLYKAQRRTDFDISELIRDEHGKLDSWKIFSVGAFILSSWLLMVVAMGQPSDNLLLYAWGMYLVVFSGSATLSKVIDTWRAIKQGIVPSPAAAPASDPGGATVTTTTTTEVKP